MELRADANSIGTIRKVDLAAADVYMETGISYVLREPIAELKNVTEEEKEQLTLLFAAAPEMHHALVTLIEAVERQNNLDKALELAKEALKKAHSY